MHGRYSVKVNASALRAGNVVEIDNKLYAVLTADNIKPGKGTPVTQLELRRVSDGVKISERFRTTEQVERAYIEDGTFQYLYDGGDAFTFMQTENYEQVSVPKDLVGAQAPYLQEGMQVSIKLHQGVPVSIELPARITLEVIDTEPAMKGQTATTSFKPAALSNGVRTLVPTHIVKGTKIIVNTADGSYVERAKG
jgi:elongation factor P